MAEDKSKSLLMAQRLKELRTAKGLSHESLRKALMDKYEIDISTDSLKNYEVSKVPHAKAYKNEGMRVEYLRCLADFYGVSSDYILGMSDIESNVKEIQAIVRNTGLSEQSAVILRALAMANMGENSDPSEFKRLIDVPQNMGNGDYAYLATMAKAFIDDMVGALVEDEIILRRYGNLITSLLVRSQPEVCQSAPASPSSNPFFADGHIAVPIDDYIAFNIHEIASKITAYLSKASQSDMILVAMDYGKG